MALIIGLIMVTLMTASLIEAQSNRDSSKIRQTSRASDVTVDSAIARILVELAKPENSELLARNFDPINPSTGRNYLGADGILNSADEATTAVDEWTGYDRSALSCYQEQGRGASDTSQLSGDIGPDQTYQLLAYRYDPLVQVGTVLIEGGYRGITSHVLLTLSIDPILDDFPGIAVSDNQLADIYDVGVLALRGREILGNKGAVYFVPEHSADPAIAGRSQLGDPNRDDHLNAVWSSGSDGATHDTVSSTLIACNLDANIPQMPTGTNLGVITTSDTLMGFEGGAIYRLDGIELSGTDILTIDTTAGPVEIDMGKTDIPGQRFELRDQAKIVNMRTDGQPPKVGDARFLIRNNMSVDLYDQTCIEQVFLFSKKDEFLLRTDGPGCSSGKNTNFEGVAWFEAILSAKNAPENRNVNYLGSSSFDTFDERQVATSGLAVPDDVSSLVDLLQYTDFPMSYRYKEVLTWQKVYL